MGLDVRLIKDDEYVKKDSVKYPEHLFKIGYFRSSYNDDGINNVLKNFGLSDLYDIFQPGQDEYEFAPNWEDVRQRVIDTLDGLKTLEFPYQQTSIYIHDTNITHENVMDKFREELDRYKENKFSGGYTTRDGYFSLEKPFEVNAIIPGKSIMGGKCIYIIYETDKESLEWYTQAMEIVLETIDYVLASNIPENFSLSWSS